MNSAPLSDLPFMAAFPQAEPTQWRAAVDKVLKGGDFEKRLVSQSADGIRIEPLYSAADASSRPVRGEAGRWRVTARVDHPEPKAACEQAIADLEGGADALTVSFAGAAAARGFGLPEGDEALETALDGVLLDLIRLRLDPAPDGEHHARRIAALVEARGFDPAATDVAFGLDPISVLATSGQLAASWPETAATLASTIHALKARGFAGPFLTADARPYAEAGATEAQELGAVLATAIVYLRALEAQGMPLAEARDVIDFTLVADTDEFMTIAKLRAARLLWQRVQQACGLEPMPMRLHAETAWRSLTRRDPWVNMLRATIATFSAGVGGADSLTVLPFTAALGLPDSFARRVARNTQLVLLEEASLWRVADPAAGAGGFEALTQALCEQGWSKMQDLEREAKDGLPGIVAALANGHVQTGLARQRALRERAIAIRREAITGTSEYANLKEAPVNVLAVPKAMPCETGRASKPSLRIDPLPSQRLAEAFEALRDAAEAASSPPVVFLATLGPVADFTARAGFARNLFEAGGLSASSGNGYAKEGATDIAALVTAFQTSGARLACLCGSDEAYAAEARLAADALTAAGAVVWLAGKPGEQEAMLRDAGVRSFVAAGCDAIAVLGEAQAAALTPLPK